MSVELNASPAAGVNNAAPESTPVSQPQIQPTQTQTVEVNPFDNASVGNELNNLFFSEQPENKPDGQQEPPKTQQEPAQQQEQPLTQEQIDSILNSDPNLQKIKALTDAGYDIEQAKSMVFAQPQEPEPQQQDFIPQPPDLNKIYETVISSPQDLQIIQRRALMPNEQDVSEYLKSFKMDDLQIATVEDLEKEYDLDEGTKGIVGMQLNALNQMKDILNFVLQRTIANEYQGHLRNINNIASQQNQKTRADQTAAQTAINKIHTELPMLKDNPNPIVIEQFKAMIQKKVNNFPENLREDEKVREKILTDTIREFKAVYPALCKKLGIEQQINPQLAAHQVAQMQNVSSSQLSTGVNANIQIDPTNSASVGKALDIMFK